MKDLHEAFHEWYRENDDDKGEAFVSGWIARDTEVDELRETIRKISNILGNGPCTVKTICEGCQYEMNEAAMIARRAVRLFSE